MHSVDGDAQEGKDALPERFCVYSNTHDANIFEELAHGVGALMATECKSHLGDNRLAHKWAIDDTRKCDAITQSTGYNRNHISKRDARKNGGQRAWPRAQLGSEAAAASHLQCTKILLWKCEARVTQPLRRDRRVDGE